MQIQTIPLSQLKASKLNVRKTGGKAVEELAASIRSGGLQQNLGVIEAGKGFEVVFGGRRLRAIQQLAKAGQLPESLTDGIPCRVLQPDEAQEASLAENTIREAMHPLDQFAAFAEMAEAGKPVADIAAAFGVTERVVEGRMRLSRVSPKLLKVYGDGGMTLEQLQAFAVVDDHSLQEKVWKGCHSQWDREPNNLRKELTRTAITESDGRVRLVGLAAYMNAGGAVKRDLFSDTVQLLDAPLLDRLVEAALADVVEKVKAEGWSWVEIGERPDWQTPKIHSEERDPTDEETEAMEAAEEAGDHATLEALESALEVWPEGAKEKAGAVVCMHHHGLAVYRGILRDGQTESDQGQDQDDEAEEFTPPAPAPKAERDPAAIPARVVTELTRLRTGELRAAMRQDPEKAVVFLAAHLADQWRMRNGGGIRGGALDDDLRITMGVGPEVEGYTAAAEMWRKRLAFDGPTLVWLGKQPLSMVDELLAFLAAESADVVVNHNGETSSGDAICAHFGVDMANAWRPSAEFLQQLPAAAIHQALEEVGITDAGMAKCRKMKKAELAGYAESFLATTTWVPECLRLPAPEKASKAKPKASRGKSAAAGE